MVQYYQLIILWTIVFVISAKSNLTDLANKSSLRATENEISHLKQQLNQESSIRLALANQLYTLNSDMIAVKKRMDAISREGRQFEDMLEDMQRKIRSLGTENQNLRTEPEPVPRTVQVSNATGDIVRGDSALAAIANSQGISFKFFKNIFLYNWLFSSLLVMNVPAQFNPNRTHKQGF